jgi:hypothetical protein
MKVILKQSLRSPQSDDGNPSNEDEPRHLGFSGDSGVERNDVVLALKPEYNGYFGTEPTSPQWILEMGTWGMMVILERSLPSPNWAIFTPSMEMDPPAGSIILKSHDLNTALV